MKFFTKLTVFAAMFLAVVQFSSCLNDDNKIPPNCYDGILNNAEELVDCGGPNCPPCDPCINGIWEPELGEQWVDCGGDCEPCDIHNNGQLDPGEDCIDCGGITGVDCGELCGDGLLNGCEEEIDCGGDEAFCPACPSCDDEIMNQDEIGIDCGGSECDPCPDGVDCTNGILDGDEHYIDCGGENCPDCDWFLRWSVNNNNTEADPAQAALAGGTISISGASTLPGVINIAMAEPVPLGWQNDIQVALNPMSFPGSQILYVNQAGVTFSSEYENSSVNVNISFVNPVAGGAIAGTFSGVLWNEDGDTSVNLSNGNFVLPFD